MIADSKVMSARMGFFVKAVSWYGILLFRRGKPLPYEGNGG